jgi:uncharacterized membrane protein
MRRVSAWLWKALILPACVGYQVLVHSALLDSHANALRFGLAAIPLLIAALWVAKAARNKLLWGGLLFVACVGVYAIDRTAHAALPATNALTHATINLFMLWFFGRTLLRNREPLITGFARKVHGTLPTYIEAYTRRVTIMWCLFFTAQLVISALLLRFATLDVWSFFVNMLSLPLVVLTFLSEYGYRVMRYRSFQHAPLFKGVAVFAAERPAVSERPASIVERSIVRDARG